MSRRTLISIISTIAIWGFLGAVIFLSLNRLNTAPQSDTPVADTSLRYLAVGDSYTIGTSVETRENWPSQLTTKLVAGGIQIRLVDTIAQNGWTTTDLLETGLTRIADSKYDLITLQIGVNDWVQKVPISDFARRVEEIVDKLVPQLPDSTRLVLISIPDLSSAPAAVAFGDRLTILKGISSFNIALKDLAARRQVTFVDIYDISQRMRNLDSYIAADNLHPSGKMYYLWVERIYPVVRELVK